jgi:hypothetical protein
MTPADFGIKIDKPDSHNGKFSVTYDWRKSEEYAEAWE